jgi:hypothetical protein
MTIVYHPQLGRGTIIKSYMGGAQWEVVFETGRRFRLPSRQFSDTEGQLPSLSRLPTARPVVSQSEAFQARQTLEALRVGIVPLSAAETLTIGLEVERQTLDRAIKRVAESGGDALAIIGDYGAGKSHFIEISAQFGLRANLLVASASLDLKEAPPNQAHKIYEALVTNLRYPDAPEQRGLRHLLDKALQLPNIVEQFVELCPRPIDACPLTAALLALRDMPTELGAEQLVQWISGQSKAQPEMKRVLRKPPRLYISGENARQYSYLLSAISTLATLCGYQGLMVLIDESEHYSLLTPANRLKADSFFKAMIRSAVGTTSRVNSADIPDDLRGEYPINFATRSNLFFAFALTDTDNRLPTGIWLTHTQILRLDDRFMKDDIANFSKTLLITHGEAYGYKPSRERYETVLEQSALMLAQALREHRNGFNLRQLIRTAVAIYDLLYLYPDYSDAQLLSELRSGLKV